MHIDHYSLPVYDKNNSDNTLKETELFKEVPYLSARLGEQAYEYSGGDISNYHLSIQYIMDVLADQAKGKVDLSHFSSEETLSSHVSLRKMSITIIALISMPVLFIILIIMILAARWLIFLSR